MPKCQRPWFMSRGISHSVLGITSSCNLLETLTGWSASTLYPEVNTLFSSQSFILVYFATWDEIKISQQSKCRSLNSWLSAKLIIINSCLWVCQGRMLRIQTISPIPGRTSSSPRPQCSSPTFAQDILCLLQDHFFLTISQDDRRPASFLQSLVSVCTVFSLQNSMSCMDNMLACETNWFWRNTPQAFGVTTTMVTSQKSQGFSWIQEIV